MLRSPLRSTAALVTLYLAACAATDPAASSETGSQSDGSTGAAADSAAVEGATTAADDTSGEVAPQAYYDAEASAALGAAGNQARCSTCHSNDGERMGYPGDSLQDVAFHTAWKGGGAPDLLAAVNACVTGWMGGPALAPDSVEANALLGYLESISDPQRTEPNPLAPEVLVDEAAYESAYTDGDAARGAALYAASCAGCHDAGLVLGTTPAPARASLAASSIGAIARQVRTSGPPPSGTGDTTDITPGPMPFFEPEELSSADLADVIAYILEGP